MGYIEIVFLTIGCFCAGFIDAIAGGGGLISLPAFSGVGLSLAIALGTNKLGAFFSTSGSALKYLTSGKVKLNLVKYMMPFSFIGGILGVKTAVKLDEKTIYPIVLVLLTLILLYTIKNKKMGEIDNEELILTKKKIIIGAIFAFILGFYDGFFGPGTGSFIIFMFIKIFKMDFINASGNAKFLNLSSNIASLITFIYYNKLSWVYGISMGIVMLLGSRFGAKTAIQKGSKFIKPVYIIITTIVLLRMYVKYYKMLNL